MTTAARLAEPTRGRLLPARPRPGRGTGRAVRLRSRVPAVAGLLCLLTGLLDILGGLTPALHARMAELSPGVPASVGQVATVVTGLVLVLLAGGLRRRRRRAYLLVCALLAASITGHLATGLDVQQATAAAVQLGLLGWFRDVFDARGDPRARWRGMAAFGLLLAASMAIGVAALNMPWMPLAGHYDLAAQARQVLFGLVGVAGPVHFTATGSAAQVADLLGDILVGLGLLTVLAPIYLVLRPAIPAASLDPAAETRLRTLLDRQGRRDSLGYFALRRDKILVWSPSGKAAIAYRAAGGVMLASGDPLGDPEAWAAAMTEFLRLAGEHGLTPAVIGCSEQAGAGWARHGLAVLELGDEAIVSVADFSLAGRGMRNVRQMVHRIERQGYTCQARRVRDIPAAERALLRARAAAWRGASTERGFSMALGRLADPADGDCVTVTAGRDGQLCAFLHFVPWGADGLSLDVMRRDRTADPGLNELLIVAALRAAPALGVTRVSLNFAMFRSALDRGQRLGAGPVLRLWRAALVFVSRWWQIESLYRFDAKFCPDWQPRYLCYPTGRDLPRVAVAALRAEAFLDWSWPRLYRRGRRHSANPQSPAAPCCADTGVALRAADADADDERQPAGAAAPT